MCKILPIGYILFREALLHVKYQKNQRQNQSVSPLFFCFLPTVKPHLPHTL